MAKPLVSTKDLRGMPAADIQQQLLKLRTDLWQHRIKAKDGALQQSHLIAGTRRQIARLLTILREAS